MTPTSTVAVNTSRLLVEHRDNLEKEIESLLFLSNEERQTKYGSHAWKLLIQRYIDINKQLRQ